VQPAFYLVGEEITMMITGKRERADIRKDVCDEMEYDPAVKVHDIAVVAEDGVVTLSGVADSFATRMAAAEAAWRVAGVQDVINNIIVDPVLLGMPTDGDIAYDVRYRLDRDLLIPQGRVEVSVSDGVVTLTGELPRHFQRAAAQNEARTARGVREVKNFITLEHGKASPREIENAIRKALERNAQVDAAQITITVDGSHVTLSGKAANRHEREAAEEAAWRARGVTTVNDDIRLEEAA
jgi:osmotically-inducible protein OsmY